MAKSDPGDWGLSFGDANLAINNPVKVTGPPPETLPEALEGLALEEVVETEISVVLQFAGGVKIEIDLSPDAYAGPEAMVLIKPSGEFVVWN